MVEEIVWSPIAVETFEQIINYLQNKFGEVATLNFVQQVDDKIKLISSRPTMFRATGKKKNTFITSIGNKTTLTYRYLPKLKKIEIVVFWGKQNPESKPN